MKPAMFRFRMSIAGYDDLDISTQEAKLERYGISPEIERDAIYEYAKVCTDLSGVLAFLTASWNLAMKAGWDFETAYKWNLNIIVAWWTPGA